MEKFKSIVNRKISTVNSVGIKVRDDIIIVERPLQIDLSYFERGKKHRKNLAITMRTPGHDIELVKGFCLTENIIQSWQQIKRIEQENPDLIHLELQEDVDIDIHQATRQVYGNSSCGICGKTSLDHICSDSDYLPWSEKWKISSDLIFQISQKLESLDCNFSQTGGNHIAVLVNQQGYFEQYFEDVGRHNAMDKLIGSATHLPLSNHLVLWSGRSSFELVQKAAKAGIPITVSIGAPSSLAIELAEEHGMTLIGFVKKDKFNVYTNPERIEYK